MDKRQLNETRLCYIYFTGCCVWTRTFILCFNTLHLLQLPWAGVKLNHSSCVCSMVPRPHRSRRRGTRTGWTEKRARQTPAYDSENWLHVTRRWQWVTFLSYHRFIASALYRWEPVDAPLGIRCFSAARVPPNQPPNSDIAPLQPYVKTAQAAIWLWVTEEGLNSPSEILEPVGKPQLFKCRKSWFYKMLIWSALGTSEQQGSEQEPPPCQYNPSFILKSRGKWGRTKGKEQGGSVIKGGGG